MMPVEIHAQPGRNGGGQQRAVNVGVQALEGYV